MYRKGQLIDIMQLAQIYKKIYTIAMEVLRHKKFSVIIK
jgi:hypothetical protein